MATLYIKACANGMLTNNISVMDGLTGKAMEIVTNVVLQERVLTFNQL